MHTQKKDTQPRIESVELVKNTHEQQQISDELESSLTFLCAYVYVKISKLLNVLPSLTPHCIHSNTHTLFASQRIKWIRIVSVVEASRRARGFNKVKGEIASVRMCLRKMLRC